MLNNLTVNYDLVSKTLRKQSSLLMSLDNPVQEQTEQSITSKEKLLTRKKRDDCLKNDDVIRKKLLVFYKRKRFVNVNFKR